MVKYDYIITKPELNEDTLAHYGVKGMKWRHHKKRKTLNRKPKNVSKHIFGEEYGHGLIDLMERGRDKLYENSELYRKYSDTVNSHSSGNTIIANAKEEERHKPKKGDVATGESGDTFIWNGEEWVRQDKKKK